MKIFKKDELFEIFKRKINALDPETQNSDELISETAGEYLERLLLRGHIPVHFLEDIQQYLMDEVKDMFRKKTYGFMNIETYKKAQKNKSRARST